MTLKNIFTSITCVLLVALATAHAQQRTTKTAVADVLMSLPAKDNAQAERLFKELISLGDEGVNYVVDQLQPNGVDAGVPYRYAVSLLTHYTTTTVQKLLIEKSYLNALSKTKSPEIKAYLLDNLKWVASNNAIPPVSALIADAPLSDQAIAVLEILNTAESKQALLTALEQSPSFAEARLLQSLGRLRYGPARSLITKKTTTADATVKRSAFWSLAQLGDPSSADLILTAASAAGFKNDPSESVAALIEYIHVLKGNTQVVTRLSKSILDNTPADSQQHLRLAALEAWSSANPGEANNILIKEVSRFDAGYRREILNIAVPFAAASRDPWMKIYKKQQGEQQAEILTMMAKGNSHSSNNTSDPFAESVLTPALKSSNPYVRIAAAQALANTHNPAYGARLVDYLVRATEDGEIASAKSNVLQLTDKNTVTAIPARIETAKPKGQIALLQIIGERRYKGGFDAVVKQISSPDGEVKKTALAVLPNVSSAANTDMLLARLSSASAPEEIAAYQVALSSATTPEAIKLVNDAYPSQKLKLIPVQPYLNDKGAIEKVVGLFNDGNENERDAAFTALLNWQNSDAVRALIKIRKDEKQKQYHAKALTAALSQTVRSEISDDQKVLLLREILSLATDKEEKIKALRAFGRVRTFLSFVVVSSYIDDADLGTAAVRVTNQLALPAGNGEPGLTGTLVRETLEKIKTKLKGEDSQYELIDVQTYLEKMPYVRGYEPIFNGKDLGGWQGLVENPVARRKMADDVLAKKQKESNATISKNWSVRDGMIIFQGEGANLATIRQYGDFEMIVDWRISKNGDSGIYLRGSPQVQIWDIARVESGAQVGSGGLYNNQKGRSTPLVVADNPVGEWNTFRITMTGEKVTVFLNGVLVVDNVTLENYWDRAIPIFPSDAIELQAHGTDLAFRDIYVKELGGSAVQMSDAEKKDGYVSLFDGSDLDQWIGNKKEYVVEENTIALYPSSEEHGNLNSAKEYSDFILRFEFQLTPGANNGIGIHTPLEGDAAYVGKEIQVLDDDAPVYAKLEPYQYHGSVYGVIPSKRGFQKPVGQWNTEEIYVKGDYFKITLNGNVITEGNVKEASKKGTMDHKDHPGLLSHKGHIAFLGHGSVVRFRNIRIKELPAH